MNRLPITKCVQAISALIERCLNRRNPPYDRGCEAVDALPLPTIIGTSENLRVRRLQADEIWAFCGCEGSECDARAEGDGVG
jgi:hypothetical protein